MSSVPKAALVFAVVGWSFLCCAANLRLGGEQCGHRVCDELQFCSEYDNLCQPCSSICDKGNHNLDVSKCEKHCQNYIHEIRFMRIRGRNDSDLRKEVETLRYLVTVTLSLVIVILVAVVLFIIKYFLKKNILTLQWIRNKFRNKISKSERANATASNAKPDLRLDMPPPAQQHSPGSIGATPTTAVTTISRRPTEDSTLDYAYDNPVMMSTPSPHHNAKPHESSL